MPAISQVCMLSEFVQHILPVQHLKWAEIKAKLSFLYLKNTGGYFH